MKKIILVALFSLPFSIFGQQKYDYFVQFNTNHLDRKIDLETFFNHKIFKEFSSKDVAISDFITVLDATKPLTIVGNFTDSISYYQVTIPIKNEQAIEQLILKTIKNDSLNSIDSIKNKTNYKLFSFKSNSFSMGWNSDFLVIYKRLTTSSPSIGTPIEVYEETEVGYEDTTAPVEVEEVEIIEDLPVVKIEESTQAPPPPPSIPEIQKVQESEVADVLIDDNQEEDAEEEETYTAEELAELEKYQQEYVAKFLAEQMAINEVQEEALTKLFENGFNAPTFSKINEKSDISAWVNYQSFYSKIGSFYYSLFKNQPSYNQATTEGIVGVALDFNFENDKMRVEQAIEYTPALAEIMQKVVHRKPSKDFFKHVPKQEPIGYFSYHLNTEEALKNYPKLSEQLLSSLPLDKKDIDVITDVFSTLLDEEATATIFDGDIALFLHNFESYSHTFTETTYNEDYEEVEQEKTITKTRPIFSMIFTSTHPTLAKKMLDLGVRKKLLQVENDYYLATENPEVGKLMLKKEGDIFVLTNNTNYLNSGNTTNFSKKLKKEISKNYFYGNLDFKTLYESIITVDELQKSSEMQSFFEKFKNLKFASSNQIKNNNLTFEMELNTNFSDKNILIQFLDLIKKEYK